MADIKFKRSAVPGKVPLTTDLELGQLAINTSDGKLFIKKDNGTASIVEIGAAGGTGGASVTISTTPPSSPNNGDLWWDEDEGILYIYYNDGSSTQWVQASLGAVGPAGTVTYPAAGIAVSTGTDWGTSKATPVGDIVGTTDTQTLSGKTLNSAILNDGYTEEVFTVTGATPALSPTNGSIQTWTLTASSTPTAGTWADGQSMTLMINDGTAFTVTWTSLAVTWKTDAGVAPTLNLTGYTVIQLWEVGGVIYGARVGNA